MKKIKKFIKNCPLAVCILCSWAIVTAAGYLPLEAREISSQETDSQENEGWINGETQEITANNALGGVIASNRAPDLSEQALMDGDGANAGAGSVDRVNGIEDLGENSQTGENQVKPDGQNDAEGASGSDTTRPTDENNTEHTEMTDEKAQKIKPEYISYEKKKTDSPWYTDPGKIPMTTEYDYQKVKKDYFDDAVFIGDSRIVGMNDYSGLTNASFFAKTGLTVYNLLDEEFVKDPETGKEVSVSYMMEHYT